METTTMHPTNKSKAIAEVKPKLANFKSKAKFKSTGKGRIEGLDMTYTGRIHVPMGKEGVKTDIQNRSLVSNISSNGGGVCTNIFSSDDVVNVDDWASLQTVWQEYRVLAHEVEFIPTAATTTTPIAMAIVGDHSSTLPALTSMNEAASNSNVKVISLGSGCQITTGEYPRYTIRASGVDELTFYAMSSGVTSPSGIKTYSTVGTNSVLYYVAIHTFTIEFRGTRSS